MAANYEETFCFPTWLSGFLMGQIIYESKNGKEMSISIPAWPNLVAKFQGILGLEGGQNGNKHIFRLVGKKLQKTLERHAPRTFNLSFVGGMMESDFGLVINVSKFEGKMSFRNYIKFQNHPIIKNKLDLFNVVYKVEAGKIKITKKAQLKRLLRAMPPRFFYLHREEALLFKKYLYCGSIEAKEKGAAAFNAISPVDKNNSIN